MSTTFNELLAQAGIDNVSAKPEPSVTQEINEHMASSQTPIQDAHPEKPADSNTAQQKPETVTPDKPESKNDIIFLEPEAIDPKVLNIPLPYKWEFENNKIVIYRYDKKLQEYKKFEAKSRSFLWAHPDFLRRNGINVESIYALDRGAILISGKTKSGAQFVIIDDFTGQINGKAYIIGKDPIVFGHSKKHMISLIKYLKEEG